MLGADNFAVRGRRFGGAIELLGERAVKNVVDERGFARARDAGDDGEQAQRKRDVDVFKIVSAGAENLYRFAVGAAALFGNCDFRGAAEVLAGEGCRGGFDLRWLALGDEVAAGVASARAEVDHKIGAADGVLIVFDDEDGVAEIAKLFERAEKTGVVAGVQADAGLVENVENAAKARADLRGEADALGFAAGERRGGAVQAEIAETHSEQKINALGN